MRFKAAMLGVALAISPTIGQARPSIAAFQRAPLEEQRVDSEGVFLLFEALKPVRNSIAHYIIENEKLGIQVCHNLAYQTFLARLHHHRSDENTRNSWEFVIGVDGFSREEKMVMWTSLANTSVLLRNFSRYVSGLSHFFDSEEFGLLSNQIIQTSERLLDVVESSRVQLRRGGLRGWNYPVNNLVQDFVSLIGRLSVLTRDLWSTTSISGAQSFNNSECNVK